MQQLTNKLYNLQKFSLYIILDIFIYVVIKSKNKISKIIKDVVSDVFKIQTMDMSFDRRGYGFILICFIF